MGALYFRGQEGPVRIAALTGSARMLWARSVLWVGFGALVLATWLGHRRASRRLREQRIDALLKCALSPDEWKLLNAGDEPEP